MPEPVPQPSSVIELVPHERQAELAAVEGRRAVTRRKLVTELAANTSAEQPTTPEMTRLVCARALGRSGRYAAAFDNAIGGLRRAGATPADLDQLRAPRAALFGGVMRRVDTELAAAGLRDERADTWLAARAARHGDPAALASCDSLLVRGFCRYDPGELELFETLHRRLVTQGGRGVTLELPRLDLAPAALALDRVARELEARWAHDSHAPSLEYREADGPLDVELVAAHDDASEARAVAHAVLDALSRGVALDRIAVVVPELSEAFLEPLRQELDAAKVPFFEPRGRPVVAAPHAHAALELMKLARGPIDRDALVDVLRTPGLDTERWSAEQLRRDEWAAELSSLPIRIDRSSRELLLELEQRSQDLAKERDEERSRLALEATRRCLAELAGARGPATRAEFRATWLRLWGELGLTGPSPAALAVALERRAAGRRELLRAVSDNGVAVRALATALERTSEAAAALGLGADPVELDDYLVELELAVEGVGPTRGARRGAALWVARPEELSGLEFDVAVLCRATSSSLEVASESSTELLGDELCQALPARLRPTSRSLSSSFSALAVAWLLRGARRTVVTHALRGPRGPTAPSQLAVALKAIARAQRREPGSPLHPSARRVLPLSAPTPDAERRAYIDVERQSYFLDPDAAPGPFTGAAGELSALVGGAEDRPVAVTALELYARCPFLTFASYVLKAARDEAPGDDIGYRERGSLIHAGLAAAHEAMKPLWGRRSPEELEDVALEAARHYLERRGQSTLRRAGLAAALVDIAAAVRWSLREGRDLPFYEAERGFGRGQGWAPLRLGRYYVSGRIDRIDFSAGGQRARVIDYKTGKAPTRAKMNEELLQPWLYGLKVAQELGVTEVESGYLSLGDRAPRLTPSVETAPDADEVIAAVARAERSLSRLSSGAVEAKPNGARLCARCDGRDLCRRPLSAPLSSEDEER